LISQGVPAKGLQKTVRWQNKSTYTHGCRALAGVS